MELSLTARRARVTVHFATAFHQQHILSGTPRGSREPDGRPELHLDPPGPPARAVR